MTRLSHSGGAAMAREATVEGYQLPLQWVLWIILTLSLGLWAATWVAIACSIRWVFG
jgi:hypothetical protein